MSHRGGKFEFGSFVSFASELKLFEEIPIFLRAPEPELSVCCALEINSSKMEKTENPAEKRILSK